MCRRGSAQAGVKGDTGGLPICDPKDLLDLSGLKGEQAQIADTAREVMDDRAQGRFWGLLTFVAFFTLLVFSPGPIARNK